MKHYCQTIMNKLKQQSNILRNIPVTLLITDKTDNGAVDVIKRTIELNPNYISDPKLVAPTIAHELAHIVYHELYGFRRNKEDEIFADVYGMILCKRAGFNISGYRDEWNTELRRIENTDEHPQSKIRYLILKQAAAYLDDFNNIEINNHAGKKKHNYVESAFDVTLRREILKIKFGKTCDSVTN